LLMLFWLLRLQLLLYLRVLRNVGGYRSGGCCRSGVEFGASSNKEVGPAEGRRQEIAAGPRFPGNIFEQFLKEGDGGKDLPVGGSVDLLDGDLRLVLPCRREIE